MRRVLIAVKAISTQVRWVSWIKQHIIISRLLTGGGPEATGRVDCRMMSDVVNVFWTWSFTLTGGNLWSIVWEYEVLTLFTVSYVMWRFIILTYPFNVVHNVKFLRFRLVIFHLGRYGSSEKFVRIFGWGKPKGGIHSSHSYSSSCYHHITILIRSNKMQQMQVFITANLLYMFRVSIAPIIRSTSNCNYIFWYRSYHVSGQRPSVSVA